MSVVWAGVALILGVGAVPPEQCNQGVAMLQLGAGEVKSASKSASAQAEGGGSAKSACHLRGPNGEKCLTMMALDAYVGIYACGTAESEQSLEWITASSGMSIRMKDTNDCLEAGTDAIVRRKACNSQAAQSFVERPDGLVKVAGSDNCLVGIGSAATTRVLVTPCYMADYGMGDDYRFLRSDCATGTPVVTAASYAACLKPFQWSRQFDVEISVAGAEACASQCKLGGFDFFGMECPMGAAVHCQCISGSGGGTNLGKDGGTWVLGTEYCTGNGDPLVHNHSHCTGPYQVDGFLFGDYAVGSMYDVHSQLADSFSDLGSGYCNAGYYAGWNAPDAVDLETCQARCLAESSCKFISFVVGSSCSRYSSAAGDCSNRASGHSDHHSYARR